jgi:DNA repair protein RadC
MGSIVEERIMGPDDAARVFRRCIQRGEVDGLLVLGLDCERAVTGIALNPTHRALATVKVWELVDLAAELDACSLVLARFPRGGKRAPSVYEAHAFVDLAERAARAHVLLLDCIVMRAQQWWSLAERARGAGTVSGPTK